MNTRQGRDSRCEAWIRRGALASCIAILAGCSGTGPPGPSATAASAAAASTPKAGPTPGPTLIAGAPDSHLTVDLVANDTTWNVSSLSVPAGKIWHIRISSPSKTVAHNFVVSTGSAPTDRTFRSDFFTGTTVTYDIPALPAGQYEFICLIHAPGMIGDLIVK
jgi:plastocyanin